MEADDFDALGESYRDAKQAVIEARRNWANLERAGASRAVLRAAVRKLDFANACVIAAGEAIKGQTFEEVMAMNTTNRRPQITEV